MSEKPIHLHLREMVSAGQRLTEEELLGYLQLIAERKLVPEYLDDVIEHCRPYSQNPSILLSLARAYISMEEVQAARHIAAALLCVGDSSAPVDVQVEASIILLRLGETDKVASYVLSKLRLAPEQPKWLDVLATCLASVLSEPSGAARRENLQTEAVLAAELNASLSQRVTIGIRCVADLAHAYERAGRPSDALALLFRARADTGERLRQLASIALPLAHLDDRGFLHAANVDRLRSFAREQYQSGRLWIAYLACGLIAAADPNDLEAKWNLGWICASGGLPDAATFWFQDLRGRKLQQSGDLFWPHVEGVRWPHAKLKNESLHVQLQKPLITIITPVLNQVEYIRDSFYSVINQNYSNIEYIVIDGGSEDGTLEFLKSNKEFISLLISESDDGQAHAINKGIARASGDIIVWLNADDVLLPYALDQWAQSFVRNPDADLFVGIGIEFMPHRVGGSSAPERFAATFRSGGLQDLREWLANNFVYQCEVAFRATTLEQRRSWLNPELHFAMDYDLWCRLALDHAAIEVVGWPTAALRRHSAQKTSSADRAVRELAKIRHQHFGDVSIHHPAYAPIRSHWSPDLQSGIVLYSDLPWVSQMARLSLKTANVGRLEVEIRRLSDPRPQDNRFTIVQISGYEAHRLSRMKAILSVATASAVWLWRSTEFTVLGMEIADHCDFMIPGEFSEHHHLSGRRARVTPVVLPSMKRWNFIQSLHVENWPELEAAALLDDSCNRVFATMPFVVPDGATDRKYDLVWTSQLDRLGRFPFYPLDLLRAWMSMPASVVVQCPGSLSFYFDSLYAGIVPIVDAEFEKTISEVEAGVGVRFPRIMRESNSAASLDAAWHTTIECVKSGGVEGAEQRRSLARQYGSLERRLDQIVEIVTS